MALDYSNLNQALARVKKQMRPYQIECVEQGISTKRILIDMFMGMGKTVCALSIMLYFRPRRVLLLCSRNSMGVWLDDMEKWYPEYADRKNFEIIRAQGKTPKQRAQQWNSDATFFISTMQTFVKDKDAIKKEFDVYIIDEAHKVPGHKTKTFKALNQGLAKIPVKIMQTGTWLKRHAGRGWRHLHLLSPKLFGSYWKFINRYCVIDDGYFGKEIIGPKNTKEFYVKIKPLVYRYHKMDGYVPKSARKIMWVDMTKEQEQIYTALSEDMIAMLDNGNLILSGVSIATFMKHRQLLNCPRILDDSLGIGAAFEGVLEHLKESEEPEEHHFVLFSFFKKSIPFFAEKLKKLGYAVWVFQGGMDALDVSKYAKEFREHKGKKSVAICTIDFSESYHLGTAIRSHFIGTHFDGDPMRQAEARLARADSDLTKTVVHKYWLYRDTIDTNTKDVIEERTQHVRKLFEHVDARKDLKELLGHGSNAV